MLKMYSILQMVTYFAILPFLKLIEPDFFQDIGQFSLLVIQQTFAINPSDTVLLFDVGRLLQAISELGQSSNLSGCPHMTSDAHVPFPLSTTLDCD
jgi:hypothetical protein